MDSPSRLKPLHPSQVAEAMVGWQQYLSQLGPTQLAAELTRLNGEIETDQRSRINTLLLDHLSAIDSPVQRSVPMDLQPSSRPDRDRAFSPSPQQGPLDLLLSSRRAGPRLVAKLVASDVRRRAK